MRIGDPAIIKYRVALTLAVGSLAGMMCSKIC